MDTTELVESQKDAGQKIMQQLAREGFNVASAFWVKLSSSGTGTDPIISEEPWFFYVVSKFVEENGALAAYRAVYASIQRILPSQDVWISPSELKLVGTNDQLASEVMELQKRFPGKTIVRGTSWLGSVAVDGLYIYPPGSAPTTEQPNYSLEAIQDEAQKSLDLLNAGKKEEVREGLNKIIFMSGHIQKG